jgi:propanol-preferring alcohol dehydrogenase
MRALLLESLGPMDAGRAALRLAELPVPRPAPGEVLVQVSVCGVCRTDLDEVEGRAVPPRLPVIPGHQVVGTVVERGEGAKLHPLGSRVGVGWIHSSSGDEGENLSPLFRATGRDVDGGYAEYLRVPERYAFPIPTIFRDIEAAPLLCAGAIGYRSLRLAGLRDGEPLGLMGFGASAHLVLQLARHLYPRSPIFVFAREENARETARELGAHWTGAIDDRPPERARSIIDTTPAWRPVVRALAALRPGGRLVINAIAKEPGDQSALLDLSYADHLWMEREVKSVANLTARDIAEFLPLAAAIPLRPRVTCYPLEAANDVLRELREGGGPAGAKVLCVEGTTR